MGSGINMLFKGIRQVAPTDLGVSQLYLNKSKLEAIKKWFNPNHMELCAPLPVRDFGNGRLTLTDGHSRAFVAYQYKVKIPIVYDMDDMVTSETGQQLYKNDIVWCQRFHIETIADLYNRIVDYSKYQSLWVKRCDFAYNLLTQTSEEERFQIQNRHPDLYLYGADKNLTIFYFENVQGQLFEFGRTAEDHPEMIL